MNAASRLPILTAMVPEDPALARDTEELYDALEDLLRVYQFRDRDRICCFDISRASITWRITYSRRVSVVHADCFSSVSPLIVV